MAAARARRRQAGVSLIEALVALAVMGFGMLAVVGVQGTLRLNSDVAKQRAEAVRIGQEAIESWRAYGQIAVDPAGKLRAYDEIVRVGETAVAGYTTNTSYTLERDVSPAAGHKSVRVVVRWKDRNGKDQSITLDSVVAPLDPALTAVALQQSTAAAAVRPLGRHGAIPRLAKDLGGGISVFKPPVAGSSDGAAGTVAWVFNNLTGMIQGTCTVSAGTSTAALNAASVAGCKDNGQAHLLSGYVRFATDAVQPTAATAESPPSRARNLDVSVNVFDGRTATCFDDSPATSALAETSTAVAYYCAIPANATQTWDGYSTIVPLPFEDVAGSEWRIPQTTPPVGVELTHRLCRYTPATSDDQAVPNDQHPQKYRTAYADPPRNRQPLRMPPLVNQNFLVILADYTCPTDVPADPSKGDFVNSNTLPHLPLPLP